jgi:hypothetical protein
VVTSGSILKLPESTIEPAASAVDFDSCFQLAAPRQCDRLVTDDLPQMEYYRTIG